MDGPPLAAAEVADALAAGAAPAASAIRGVGDQIGDSDAGAPRFARPTLPIAGGSSS